MINMVGHVNVPQAIMSDCHLHWYDKAPRPGRKIGHINVTAVSREALAEQLTTLSQALDSTEFPAVKEAADRLR